LKYGGKDVKGDTKDMLTLRVAAGGSTVEACIALLSGINDTVCQVSSNRRNNVFVEAS
jgi:hypothetical protein